MRRTGIAMAAGLASAVLIASCSSERPAEKGGAMTIRPVSTPPPLTKDGAETDSARARLAIIDTRGRGTLLAPRLDTVYVRNFSRGLAAIRVGRKWGYLSRAGKLAIQPTYLVAGDFSEQLAPVMIRGDKREIKPFRDVPMIDLDYLWARDGASVWDAQWGYINTAGKIAIPGPFHDAESFHEGMACVTVRAQSSTGQKATNSAQPAWVAGMGPPPLRRGYIDRLGKFTIRPQFARARRFSDGMAAVTWPDAGGEVKWGYIDRIGRTVIQPRFHLAYGFNGGLARVCLRTSGGDKIGYIDKSGAFVIKPDLEYGRDVSENRIAVKIGGKWGFMDRSGRVRIQSRFANAHRFSDGLAPVKLDRKWGYIDANGKFVVRPQFNSAGLFRCGIARVSMRIAEDEKGSSGEENMYGRVSLGFIDKKGSFILPPTYFLATDFREGAAFVLRNVENDGDE